MRIMSMRRKSEQRSNRKNSGITMTYTTQPMYCSWQIYLRAFGMSVWKIKLYPAWYYIAPDLAGDACLKLTVISFEITRNYNMILMIKAGIQGGIINIMHRYSEAYNKYMVLQLPNGEVVSNFDPKKASKYIRYLRANNLCGWAICLGLPVGKFKWMK